MNRPPKYWPGDVLSRSEGGSRNVIVLECRLDIDGGWKYQCLYSVLTTLPTTPSDFDEDELKPKEGSDE